MNYQKIYDSLIERGRGRILNTYKEKHHIIPRCLGGSDVASNIVDLTPEEHYIAHQLLVKIHNGNHALVKAATMMIPNRPSNKMYGWLRKRFSTAKSIEQSGTGNSQYGTFWIHDPKSKVNKRIRGSIPDGWVKGKYKKPKLPYLSKSLITKQENVKLYAKYFEIYNQYGFNEFVKITNYKFSQQNLVQRFAKLLDNFKPQNGKKRQSKPL